MGTRTFLDLLWWVLASECSLARAVVHLSLRRGRRQTQIYHAWLLHNACICDLTWSLLRHALLFTFVFVQNDAASIGWQVELSRKQWHSTPSTICVLIHALFSPAGTYGFWFTLFSRGPVVHTYYMT